MKVTKPVFFFFVFNVLVLAGTVQAQWPIGIQLSSMKGSKDIPSMMAQLRQWGVTELEGGWPRTMPVKEYRRQMKENGLRMVGIGADFKQLQDSVALVADRARQLGAEYVVCYWIPHGQTFTLADADNAIAVFTKAGRFLRKKGLTLCYHNHGYEFVRHGSGNLFDYLVERMPAEAVQFELDVIWAKNTRQTAQPQNPTALLRKYAGRFPLVHLKDRRPGTPSTLENPALRPHQVALGQGDIGLSRFLQEACRSGVKHLFIEDESLKPFEQIPQSISFLRQWEAHKDEIRLLVRADDLGMAHSANRACLDALTTGIARSAEVMAPTAWLPEALGELAKQPTADVGVHLTLTSEWPVVKWRPLTTAPSLTDSAGYFFPTCWKGNPAMPSFLDHELNLLEVEQELRAQIERVRQALPRQVSHLSTHMAFDRADPRLRELVEKLAVEYGLPTLEPSMAEPFPKFDGQQATDPAERTKAFAAALEKLEPGTYLLVTHPAYHTDDMKPLGEKESVALSRNADTAMLKSPAVQAVIAKKGIQLVNYRDVLGVK
ncbi:ChbG/HpnK family deacetylase [Larkinella sp. VNQ87]|uniref:ChbG/HpnK family deacetylase n=1 Tax=Larkinella sp. VNQ87 TaxID=3400921 RepID=UPI003C0094EA